MAQSCSYPLGRWLLVHDLGPPGCREEPGEWLCPQRGPAHQLCSPLTALFALSQLQKAADPWVLKHSDLEKQDNSWKEVSGIQAALVFLIPGYTEKSLTCGDATERMLTCPTGHALTSWAPQPWGLYPHGSSLWCGMYEGPSASKSPCDLGQVTLPLWAPIASLVT